MNLYQNEIIEHAKKSAQNMRVAIEVGLSFEKLRETLIHDFAMAMEERLKKENWEEIDIKRWIDAGECNKKYAGITFRKSHWPLNIFVKIEARSTGSRDYICGVTVPPKNSGTVDGPTREAIMARLNKTIGAGSLSPSWPWYQDLKSNYKNFNQKETIMALYEKENMLNDLINDIEEIEKALDSLYPKAGRADL